MAEDAVSAAASVRLRQPIDPGRDHVRGGGAREGVVSIVLFGDYLCSYCRNLRHVLARLRNALGERLAYVFRHFPNERAHPGAELISRAAEAAGRQGRYWELHDWLYEQEPPIDQARLFAFVQSLGLDLERFRLDVESESAREHVAGDRAAGRSNGVVGTPTLFINGLRYDGAWDFYSMLEALELPVAARVHRSARVFASLPAAGGIVLLLAAAAALVCANSPLAPYYRLFVESSFDIGPPGHQLSLSVGDWFSEGLLGIFFLVVGLEIRREMTVGTLAERRAATLPIVAALGGVLAPTAVYLALNPGSTAVGWSVPTATDIAFTLGILAVLGERIPAALRVFVAALAVVDDILSVLTLAIFYPRHFDPAWLALCAVAVGFLYLLNRGRVRAGWPYALVTLGLWIALHGAGVHAALAGVLLAAFVPTLPAPAAGPLLAQAASALAELEHAESELAQAGASAQRSAQEPIWDWASRNLSAATERLLSPADRLERAVAPWTAYAILPLFAFSATGVRLDLDLSQPDAGRILLGVVLGLVIGKPLGVSLASWLAIRVGLALPPVGVSLRGFLGAACLCGVGDTVALLMADQAFANDAEAGIAKLGVLLGSALAGGLGALVLVSGRRT
jgi:NhaA family Na+:H+ antiporter